MQLRVCVWALALAVCVSPALAGSVKRQEKVLLEFKPEAGQSAKSKDASKITFSAQGQLIVIEDNSVFETEVVSADAEKSVLRSKTVSSKTTINGDPLDSDPDDSTTDTTFARNGQILAIKHNPEIEDELQIRLENSVAVGTAVIFSSEPIGAGDTWTHDYPESADFKVAAAKATFTVIGFEELDGVACAKIKMDWSEKSGSPAMKVSSTQWIEIASGDAIKIESKVTGAKFDFGFGEPVVLSIESKSGRTSGGLVKSDTNKPEGGQDAGAIDQAVEGFEKLDGFLTLYKKTDGGKTVLKLEVKKSQLGTAMMLQTTASTGLADGRLTAGDPINDLVFEFRRLPNNRLAMYVPNYLYRADNNLAIARAVRRSFPDSLVDSFEIEAEQADRDSVLIDVTDMFRGDLGRVAEILAGGGNPILGGGGTPYILDRENSYLASVANFPKNLSVRATLNFIGRGGGGPASLLSSGGRPADDRSVVLSVEYNLFALPVENGYQPRLYDSRVGFFTTDFTSYDDPTANDLKVQYINRWNLVKKDPSAAVSDPVEPIVFWIDNATPPEYRDAVKAGIEGWNAAFLEAGFSNAVIAKQMPDDANFDHADMRYNVVRWVASPDAAYAIALMRANPLTGEILNASVTIDANIVRTFAGEYGVFIRPEAWQARVKRRLASLAANGYGPNRCDLLTDGNLSMLMGMTAAAQMAGVSRSEYVNQFVHWVVSHEVGHLMGLRHNFVASTLLSLDQLGNPATVAKEGTAASVMDYVAFNPSALKNPEADFFSQTVGRYDKWAIKFGYTPFAGKSTGGERYDLYQIAQQGTREGLAWLGDEYADGIDPYVTRFDLGTDPLAYWTKMGSVSRQLMLDLPATTLRPGESYYTFTREFDRLFSMYGRSAIELTRFVGGVRRSPSYPSDPGGKKPIVTIPATTQRAALDQVVKMVFAKDSLSFPKGYFKNFTVNPKADFIEQMMAGSNDFPVRDILGGLQLAALDSLLDPGTMARLVNQEYKAEPNEKVLTIVDLFQSLHKAIWVELGGNGAVDPLRRDLQKSYVDSLIAMVLEKRVVPADALVLARYELTQLRGSLAAAAKANKDSQTALHYADLSTRIGMALDAKPTVGASGGGSPSLLDLLQGG